MNDDENIVCNPIDEKDYDFRSIKSPQGTQSHNQENTEFQLPASARRTIQLSSRDFDSAYQNNVDLSGSTYALQIALKNMKERYQKLQKKLAVLEDENTRLIGGKSELFGEIGKMQDSSIKLREKNLQLNHEVHFKHQECCSVKDQLAAYSQENMKLTSKLLQTSNEKKKLARQVEELNLENGDLREGLSQLLNTCRAVPGLNVELNTIEALANRSRIRTELEKTKILLRPEPNDEFADSELMSASEDGTISIPDSTVWMDSTRDVDMLSVEALELGTRRMRKMASLLLKQKQALLKIKPQLETVRKDSLEDRLDTNYNSRFATYHSTNNPATITLTQDSIRRMSSPTVNDSGGETNVLVEEKIVSGRRSPFDWRQVEVSDDDNNEPATIVGRPQMRTVSTSPDLTLTFDLTGRRAGDEDEERTCPMCNAIFPLVVAQETFESHVVSHFEAENGFQVIN